jgi:hypothetical protein
MEENQKKVVGALSGFAAVVIIAAYVFVIGPKLELDELAERTCKDISGMMMLAAAGVLNKRTEEAEELGFEGSEFGDALREECPVQMQQFADFVEEFRK